MRLISVLLFALLPGISLAAGGAGVPLKHMEVDLSDKASLQNGARLFVNYCQGCHSAKFMRYNRIARDLGLTNEQVEENLMFVGDKIGGTMQTSLDPEAAETFFGVVPPDLSVISRSRGTDWLYTYMLSFYRDDSRPTGTNNLMFKDVGMPHVMWELQGWQKPVYETQGHGENQHEVVVGVEPLNEEGLSAAELKEKADDYRRNVRDLVNFLAYVGEPAKMQRQVLGWWVLFFLAIFTLVAYWMKRDFWRDIH